MGYVGVGVVKGGGVDAEAEVEEEGRKSAVREGRWRGSCWRERSASGGGDLLEVLREGTVVQGHRGEVWMQRLCGVVDEAVVSGWSWWWKRCGMWSEGCMLEELVEEVMRYWWGSYWKGSWW